MKVKIVKPDAKRILKSTDGMQIVGVYRASDTVEIDLDIKDPCEECTERVIDDYSCIYKLTCYKHICYQCQKSILDKLEVR